MSNTTGITERKRQLDTSGYSFNELKALNFINKTLKKTCRKSKNSIEDGEPVSLFSKVTTRLYLSLAPMYLNNPIEGIINQHLNNKIMKYDNNINGIVIGFENIVIEQDLLKVNYETPYIFLYCTVDFIIWAPKRNDIIQGYPFIQSESHIGCLILDLFNCFIKLQEIPNNWEYRYEEDDSEEGDGEDNGDDNINKNLGYWVDGNGERINGKKIDIKVKQVKTNGKMVSIEGSLILTEELEDKNRVENLAVVSNKKIVFDEEISKDNESAHKDLELSKMENNEGEEIVYASDSEDETD
ncbi:hypothetical protein ACO0SA_003703 [Hanseniaspora valbyensis]